jgi:dolichol-phosphate mannosyltransferase
MDADLEDQPEHIPLLVNALVEQACDIVYTTKVESASSLRTFTSDAYHQVFSRAVGIRLPRQLGTFRVFTRKVRDALRQFPERDVLYGPLMFYVGFRFVIVPVARGVRPGRSSYSFAKRLRLAVNSLVTYSDIAPTVLAVTGMTMIVLPLLYGAIVLLQYFVTGRSLGQGLTLVVLLITFLSGTILLALGMLGVYVFRIFQEVLARPRYVVDETANLEGLVDGRP